MAPLSATSSRSWRYVVIALAITCFLTHSGNSQPTESSSIQTLQAERKANAESLKSALTHASSVEQRRQAIIAFQQKNETIQKQLPAIHNSHTVPSIPSQHMLDGLPANRRAAVEQQQTLAKQFKQIVASGNGLTPVQRATALANWRKSWVTARDQLRASMATLATADSSNSKAPPNIKALPPGVQNAFAGIQQSENDRKTLKASMATMTPEQRAVALRQWASTMQARLKAYRDQLKAARTASSQSTAP